MTTDNGKESEKEYVDMCAVHLKLTHCKSTTLQLKILKKKKVGDLSTVAAMSSLSLAITLFGHPAKKF